MQVVLTIVLPLIPDESRAYAGIGCHYMVQWMDRSTIGYTHMGGEGANWIGEANFQREIIFFKTLEMELIITQVYRLLEPL